MSGYARRATVVATLGGVAFLVTAVLWFEVRKLAHGDRSRNRWLGIIGISLVLIVLLILIGMTVWFPAGLRGSDDNAFD
jgi:hypothetical protein